ncbi:hypothetical protein YSY43_38960 [Paenibacillus sp. YSY-4.3]
MISYKDLTCYCLHHFENSYNVGWIDVKDDFPKASLSQEFIAKLWEYIKFPLNAHRSSNDSVLVHYNGEKNEIPNMDEMKVTMDQYYDDIEITIGDRFIITEESYRIIVVKEG